MAKTPWKLHPDRALPAEPTQRTIAREIYESVAALPIVSMHGHIDAGFIRRNDAFGDPAELFIIPDHYLVRMLVSQGYRHEDLGVRPLDGDSSYETDHRLIWRRFCENWKLFRGTPTRYWMEHELALVFGITDEPSAATADAIYDQLSAALATPEYRIRSLFDRFNIEILSTTDAPDSDLAEHAALAAEGWGERVVPTFRPDGIFYPDRAGWRAAVRALAARNGSDITDYASFLVAVQERRLAFVAAGARATDHGHLTADTTPLSAADAQRIFAQALVGPVDAATGEAFAANMLFESARMSVEDGLVMQLHPGVQRDHSDAIATAFGPDNGFDIPLPVDYTRGLQPLLNAFGLDPRFRIILFTIDETVYSRELAPIAGAYPSVRLGAPWWFLDSPGGMARFRELVTETAGFYNTSGFVDDTRAFASIPARHDLARRIDAGYLAGLVAEHRLTLDEATETAVDLAYTLPLTAYARRDTAAAGAAATIPAPGERAAL
ncbi:glucuronate isomerase [Cryobacterium roopkundense]|uniref:Uronate isomerase n=1 Tax=Cryobacterium roopkundense TaxID=1001240 RepID=A0A099J3M8_9MICO|nr:glucuronate isomerase [Cryobacterium roopkundense]KGJ72048.1 glucuronate isomerase [Cryobacterium roopkundense]MBB5642605.1 glucuronate isomerase [Cryobacterium roopkundense]